MCPYAYDRYIEREVERDEREIRQVDVMNLTEDLLPLGEPPRARLHKREAGRVPVGPSQPTDNTRYQGSSYMDQRQNLRSRCLPELPGLSGIRYVH